MAAMVLDLAIAPYLFGVFAGVGVYLIIGRPWRLNRLDRGYLLAAALFAAGSVLIGLANGSLLADPRFATYPLYYLAMAPLAVGLVLVDDPLERLVLGARIGLILLFFWGLAAAFAQLQRYGFGSNPANAAFSITFIAILSRLTVRPGVARAGGVLARLPAALRRTWSQMIGLPCLAFYLALLPVVVTGTRAVLPVFAIAALFDFWRLVRGTAWRRRMGLPFAGLVVAALAAAWLLAPFATARFEATMNELRVLSDSAVPLAGPQTSSPSDASEISGLRVDGRWVGGMPLRMIQWRAAAEVLADHPVLGVGSHRLGEALLDASPPAYRAVLEPFSFTHNMILDEGLQRGLAGILLSTGFFVFAFARLWRRGAADVRENLGLLAGLTVCFGMLHYIFLVDRHVALYSLYFLVLTTTLKKRRNEQGQLPGAASPA
ncbi:O-antigen ligase family protein [Pseudohoeflea coraliihabitans]|uniref:O-antigen ligase family protein n=1 Tax=Pseudohoeflea coraliihabitans TaxID=2860393 RepID=A0ABS6WRL0_9HYPH|nr:O-antigen ligase family protein [Pseudohoeflea sp. DP4N28-3]MBW3097695.1 O-antigen ligase family protein [Pseudohoeflea sp. DP4N28-3]